MRNFLHGTTLHGAMRLKDVSSPNPPLPLYLLHRRRRFDNGTIMLPVKMPEDFSLTQA